LSSSKDDGGGKQAAGIIPGVVVCIMLEESGPCLPMSSNHKREKNKSKSAEHDN
jgi:hypothetical protein